MPSGLRRYHDSGQPHFLTFSCYQRQPHFHSAATYDLFVTCLEDMRVKFGVYVYGYVVMPEHVHLLVSEPERGTLADAMHYLKLSFTKRLRTSSRVIVQKKDANPGHVQPGNTHHSGPFWQARGHDRNVRDAEEFAVKLRYIHENPVKRGLVTAAEDWKWSSFRHYAFRDLGLVEIESEWTARDREACGQPRIFLRTPV